MNESPHEIKQVAIEEFYSKDDEGVWWNYRFNGLPWERKLTPLKEIPWVVVGNLPNTP